MKQIKNTPQIPLCQKLKEAMDKAELLMPIETEKAVYKSHQDSLFILSVHEIGFLKHLCDGKSIVDSICPAPNLMELVTLMIHKEAHTLQVADPDTLCTRLISFIWSTPDLVRDHWETLRENQ